MKKYAMVAINSKLQDDGLHIRRVLVSYLFKRTKNKITVYYGTKLLSVDPYFNSTEATHRYTLKDSYYKLDYAESSKGIDLYWFNPEIYNKRRYHSLGKSAIEFTAPSKQMAVHKFKVRKELR